MGCLQLEIVARLGAVFAGVGGVWWDVLCCSHIWQPAGDVPVTGVSSRARPMSHRALQGALTQALFTGHSH